MKLDLDLNEIKRYLNYHDDIIDELTLANINKAIELVEKNAKPKYVKSEFSIEIYNDIIEVDNTTLKWKSKNLSRFLKDCSRVILIVATLGLELDYLIKKLEITDLSMAYLVNGVAVEYLEKYLDYIQDTDLDSSFNKTSRFSIGYGDLDLSCQNDFVNILDATKKIGVNVLETSLMVPSKSVSAIIGLSEKEVSDELAKCDLCLDNGKCSGRCMRGEEQ